MKPNSCFVFSKDDVDGLSGSLLYGFAYDEESLIFGTTGIRDYQFKKGHENPPSEGRFAGIFVGKDYITIKADATGQELIYIFRKDDYWAVSNSFMLLANHASQRFPISFYPPAAVGFLLKNGRHIGEQLISHKTMIDEIKLLPFNSSIKIDKVTKNIKIDSTPFLEYFDTSCLDYRLELIRFVQNSRNLLRTVGSLGKDVYLSLSGGFDSRIVLGLSESIFSSGNNFFVRSHAHVEDEFPIAKKLCETLRVSLNELVSPGKAYTLSSAESIRMYLLSCGGTYLPFYPVNSANLGKNFMFRLTGDQPTAWSHFEGNALFNGNADKIANDIKKSLSNNYVDKVVEDYYSTFDLIGISAEHPLSMLAHYCSIRSRHHCGRNWYKSLGNEFLITPLVHSSMMKIQIKNNLEGYGESRVFSNIYSLFGKWATEIEFEPSKSSLPEEYLEEFEAEDFADRCLDVYGEIGLSSTNSVSSLEFPIRFFNNPEEIKDLLGNMFSAVNSGKIAQLFGSTYLDNATAEINKRGTLSHDYRSTLHIISTDLILKLVEASNE